MKITDDIMKRARRVERISWLQLYLDCTHADFANKIEKVSFQTTWGDGVFTETDAIEGQFDLTQVEDVRGEVKRSLYRTLEGGEISQSSLTSPYRHFSFRYRWE